MRISIWQQFSSNHSAKCEVVGKFSNIEAATEAAVKLRDILWHITQHRTQFTESEPTFAEVVFAQEYGIEWKYSLDWIYHEPSDHVKQIENYVYCGSLHSDTWLGAKPIDALIAKLGADEVYADDKGDVISVELSCEMPNEETVQKIYAEVEPYLAAMREERDWGKIPEPWRPYAPVFEPYYSEDMIFFGYVHVIDVRLKFSKLKFSELGHGLTALIGYLNANGATQLAFTIAQRDMNEVYDS